MEKLSSSMPVVHVSPIWPKRRKPRSFKKSTNLFMKILRFIHPDSSNCAVEVTELTDESVEKEKRLRRVKSFAKCKEDYCAKERNRNGWTMYREKMKYLHYLERMENGSGKRSKAAISVPTFAQLLPDNRVNERRQKGFLNSEQTGLEKFAPGVRLNTPKATASKSQISIMDAKLDPRFQNLMRSLTPIDC